MKLVLLCIRKKIYSLSIIVTNSRGCLWVLNGVYVVIMVLSSRVSGHLIGSSGDVWKVSVGSFGEAAFFRRRVQLLPSWLNQMERSKAPNFKFHCRKIRVGAGESAEIGSRCAASVGKGAAYRFQLHDVQISSPVSRHVPRKKCASQSI